jgi:hypothetical protein
MAKARYNHPMDIPERDFWKALFYDLKSAVIDDKIACPESEFHHEESSLARRTESDIIRTASELSLGLEFKLWDSMLDSLIEEAAYKFLGKSPPLVESWAIAFSSDPRAPVESRLAKILGTKVRIDVSFSLPDDIINRRRQSKIGWVVDSEKALSRGSCSNWSDELMAQKRSFIYTVRASCIIATIERICQRYEI